MRALEALLCLAVGAALGIYIQQNVTCKNLPFLNTTVCAAKTG